MTNTLTDKEKQDILNSINHAFDNHGVRYFQNLFTELKHKKN